MKHSFTKAQKPPLGQGRLIVDHTQRRTTVDKTPLDE